MIGITIIKTKVWWPAYLHFENKNALYIETGFQMHDDVIKWKYFPRHWPFVRGIHRSPVNSPHKGQWRGALMFPLTCAWLNGWVNIGGACDLRRHRAHFDVTVMVCQKLFRSHLHGATTVSPFVITSLMKACVHKQQGCVLLGVI